MNDDTTHFGYERVPTEEKSAHVRRVFDSVAEHYDVMNDLMSLGIHRWWKRFAVAVGGVREGQRVLDLAGGTGDLARLLAERVGDSGSVVIADINAAMLDAGRRRQIDHGVIRGIDYVQADAQSLPFPDESFDCVSMGFGLRNITDKARALASMFRVLRPGGQVLILEFSRLTVPALEPLYDTYSFKVLPWLGRVVAGDASAYRYLAESIRMHPDQQTLSDMMRGVGFERVDHHNLLAGVAALHRGRKL